MVMSVANTKALSSAKPALIGTFSPRPALGGFLQRKCACGGAAGMDDKCEDCQQKDLGVQRFAGGPGGPAVAPPVVHEVLRASGQPLGAEARQVMESRFGHQFSRIRVNSVLPSQAELTVSQPDDVHEREADEIAQLVLGASAGPTENRYDFSQVRIHTDAKAVDSARAVHSRAYTVGSHLVFGASQYAPGSAEGRRLLAHELAHVVQARQVASRTPADDPYLMIDPLDSAGRRTNGGAAMRPVDVGTDGSRGLARQLDTDISDAGAPDPAASDTNRSAQVECVKRLGGCSSTRPAGIPTPEEIAGYNQQCRDETAYAGADVTPSNDECQVVQQDTPDAWVCARPLHYPALSLVFNHAYVESPPRRYGIIAPLCTPSDGGPNSLLWGGTAARTWDDSPDPCGETPDCVPCHPKAGVSDVKECLDDAFAAYNSPALHKALGPNSNTFAGTLARTCCRGINGSPFHGITPGWDDAPAPSRLADCPPGPPACS
jgi:hypothetical protein